MAFNINDFEIIIINNVFIKVLVVYYIEIIIINNVFIKVLVVYYIVYIVMAINIIFVKDITDIIKDFINAFITFNKFIIIITNFYFLIFLVLKIYFYYVY